MIDYPNYWWSGNQILGKEEDVLSLLNVTTNIIKKIDEKRCRWYGHVKRMRNDRLPKLLMKWQPDIRNSSGCPFSVKCDYKYYKEDGWEEM